MLWLIVKTTKTLNNLLLKFPANTTVHRLHGGRDGSISYLLKENRKVLIVGNFIKKERKNDCFL